MSVRSGSRSPLRGDQANLGYGETDSIQIRSIQSPRPDEEDGAARDPDDHLHTFSHAGSSRVSRHTPSHAASGSARSRRSGASRSARTHGSSHHDEVRSVRTHGSSHHDAPRSVGDPADFGQQPTYVAPSQSSRRRSGRPRGSGSVGGGYPEPTSFGGGSSPPTSTPFGHGMVPGKTLFLPLQVHGKAKGHLHVPEGNYVDISRPTNQKGRKGRIDLLPVRAGSHGESPEPVVDVAQGSRGNRAVQELSTDMSTVSPVRVRGPNVLEIAVPAKIVVSITEPAISAGETAERSYFVPLVKPKPRREHADYSRDDPRGFGGGGGVTEGGQMDARPPMRLYGPTTVEVHAPAGTFVDISRPRNVKGKKGRINLLPGDESSGRGGGGIQTFPEDDYEEPPLPTRAPYGGHEYAATPHHEARSLSAHEAPLHDIPLIPESPPPLPTKTKSPKLGFFGTLRRKLTRSKTAKSRMSDLPTHYEDPNYQPGELDPQHSIRTESHHPAERSVHSPNAIDFGAPPPGVNPEVRSPTERSAATLQGSVHSPQFVHSPQPMSVRTESVAPETPKLGLFGTLRRRLTRKSTRRTAMTSIRQPASSHRTSVREREARDAPEGDEDRAVSAFDFEMEQRELDLDPDEMERNRSMSTRGPRRQGTASTRGRSRRAGTTSTARDIPAPYHDDDMDHFHVGRREQDMADNQEAEEMRRETESGLGRENTVLGERHGESVITGDSVRDSLELTEAPRRKRTRIWRRKKGKKQPKQFRPSPPPSDSESDDEAHWCICC